MLTELKEFKSKFISWSLLLAFPPDQVFFLNLFCS